MTRGQLKTLFGRRAHDVGLVQWSAIEVNEIINLAYSKVQKEIVKFKRDAHLFWDYVDTQPGVSLYPLPPTFGVRRIGLKGSSADTTWTKLHKKEYEDLLELSPQATKTYYCLPNENWFGIYPAPASAIVRGIELIHCPIMALSDDAEIPRIKLPLHDAIALWAVIIAKGETDEDSAAAQQELANIMGDLNLWYEAPSDEPDKFQVGLV